MKTLTPHRGRRLGRILVERGIVSEDAIADALAYGRQWDRPLGQSLVALGYCSEADVLEAKTIKFDLESISLANLYVPRYVLDFVDARTAFRLRAIPIGVTMGVRRVLHVATASPERFEALADLEFRTGMDVAPLVAGDDDMNDALWRFYGEDYGDLPILSRYLSAPKPQRN